MFQAMKSLNIKDAIYTLAKSWAELKPDTLRKSRCKLWPEVMNDIDKIKDEQNYIQEIIFFNLYMQTSLLVKLSSGLKNLVTTVKPVKHLTNDQIVSTVLEKMKNM